ncbi:Late embryogenesis abundant protein, LEA-14 [Corchorus capsularis]|uniref:Late embryogenesis abundant protein, LEA-14 n=1 Tax=Corchorus capsularis TaxID=210143 RepID=A0A1R3HB31_COCAP|nr:Late embryogenesis abundant protein, LEA-14 [Corchorus capsularis]
MADRVHPGDSPTPTNDNKLSISKLPPPSPEKPVPQPGTYVIQIPKDQIYRVPPPENASRYAHLSKRKASKGVLRRCCCCFLTTMLVLLTAAAIAAAVIYFYFKPEAPSYSVESVAIKGFNLTSSSALSPEFDIAVRAHNPNDKIGIYYEKGSSVRVFYEDVDLCNGALPVFYQPTNNVTLFQMALKGSGIELTNTALRALSDEQSKGAVPFKLRLRAPVKIKVGAVKTWEITVKVTCKITVDKLTAASKIVSKDCNYGVNLW